MGAPRGLAALPEVPGHLDPAPDLPALRRGDGAMTHARCTHADWDADAGAMVLCTRAGTHGDPRYPQIRWCTAHRQAVDELLIRPSAVSSTEPPTQRWEQYDGE
jgi:hypothetical protein